MPTSTRPSFLSSWQPDAVSVASSGIVPKAALGAAGYDSSSGSFDDGGGWGGARERLMVDDPLTGRDVSAGTYR
jgi:hypothetical protein